MVWDGLPPLILQHSLSTNRDHNHQEIHFHQSLLISVSNIHQFQNREKFCYFLYHSKILINMHEKIMSAAVAVRARRQEFLAGVLFD